MSITLSFHGAAGCVTGFCARLQTPKATILIDCGMFQGSKTLKALNYDDFPFDPKSIDAVLLTHAHIDHSGLLPKLMKAGFSGPIYATAATRDLCRVMLADAGGIQESEVKHLNRRNAQRGRPAVKPIYTEADARQVMAQFEKVKLGVEANVAPGIEAVYWEAGHILGSASIEVLIEDDEGWLRLLFSGDLGPGGRDYMPDPEGPAGCDHLIVESTYGDRERARLDDAARRVLLAKELNEAHDAGGPVLIPAFAVERSQELLIDLMTLMDEGQVPKGPIFLDSPLAIEATEVFQQHGWNRATQHNPFQDLHMGERLKFLRTPAESDTLERLSGWHIILAASGMCDAGRVRKHLKRLLWRRQATVLISGYQAVGTLGRILQGGARRVTIQGDPIQVRARIRSIDAYSAHADAAGLADWVKARGPVGGEVFLLHGEPPARAALRERLVAGGLDADHVLAPDMDESYVLRRHDVVPGPAEAHRIAPQAVAAEDWHNARAEFLLELDERLKAEPNDAARDALLGRLAHDLDADHKAAAAIKPLAYEDQT
ncbi:MAG: MBL fold metallo-hydrolase [Proteobacteria bacterium]|nr:MBL fold metallo-hydrolase [Pseudomonadota bacterium]